ncbi:MAG TPA: hypothetical protein VFR23_19410 [Jiangellaceae bacterium]|nr:hypothetical protein [Jiangellaceae bacterium]
MTRLEIECHDEGCDFALEVESDPETVRGIALMATDWHAARHPKEK